MILLEKASTISYKISIQKLLLTNYHPKHYLLHNITYVQLHFSFKNEILCLQQVTFINMQKFQRFCQEREKTFPTSVDQKDFSS